MALDESDAGMAPRRRLSPDDRREEILAAARAVFRETGLTGTTMADVAERAGITQTHLYRHFRKEDLYQQAVLDPLEELGERVARETKELAERPGITRSELLEHFHALCLAYFVELMPLLRAGTAARGPAGPWLYEQAMFPKWRALVLTVAGDISGWEAKSVNLELFVRALMGLYSTIALVAELDDTPVDADAVAATLASMFAPGHADAQDKAVLGRAARRVRSSQNARSSVAVTPDASPPRKRLSRAERQASILLAARGLFCETGFSGARTQELAQRSGITEAFLYRQFSSKEELYEAAIEAPLEAALVELAAATRAAAAEHEGVAFVIEWTTIALHFLVESGALVATAFRAEIERSRSFFRERAQPHFDVVGEVIVAKLAYDTRQVTPRLAWCAFLGSLWGVSIDICGDRPELGVDAVALHLARFFTLGVVPTRGARSGTRRTAA
jgi:AcrR family transcriptional regulator